MEQGSQPIRTESRITPPKQYHISAHLPYEEQAVKEALREEGLYIASPSGMITDGIVIDPIDIIGIAKKTSRPPKRLLERIGLFNTSEYFHIGTLWINYRPCGASREENWILEVFGEEDLNRLSNLAEGVTNKFRINLETRLVNEKPRRTYFVDDGLL